MNVAGTLYRILALTVGGGIVLYDLAPLWTVGAWVLLVLFLQALADA